MTDLDDDDFEATNEDWVCPGCGAAGDEECEPDCDEAYDEEDDDGI